MSITSDLRSYADTAVNQGKHLVDEAVDRAQAQLNDVTGQANEFYGKAKGNVTEFASDFRASAEKAVNFEAIKTAVEPYVNQVKGYTHSVTDRAEALFDGIKNDERVAKLVEAAKPVVETVQERVVKPVQSLTGRAVKSSPVKLSPKAATRKPAVTKPAATKPAEAKPAAAKPASRPAARKAPAKRTTS